MNYTIHKGAFIHRLHRGRHWESLTAARDVTYADTERAAFAGGLIPLPNELGPHLFFRLPIEADPWILLAVHDTLVSRSTDAIIDSDPDSWVIH